MEIAVPIAAGVVLLGAAVPSPLRAAFRVGIALLAVLSPVIGLGFLISRWPRATPGTWLGLVPVAVTWLAWMDLRWGVSGRMSPPRPRRAP